jgi:hypothetical protein
VEHTLAVIEDGEVLIAGPILSRRWQGLTLKIDAGDGWALWRKRLVLNHALATSWVDGEVLIDEDNPAPQWILAIAGQTYGGVGAAIIRESLKWGQLLVDPPAPEPGTRVKTYNGWDLASVHDRLQDLGALEGGRLSCSSSRASATLASSPRMSSPRRRPNYSRDSRAHNRSPDHRARGARESRGSSGMTVPQLRQCGCSAPASESMRRSVRRVSVAPRKLST